MAEPRVEASAGLKDDLSPKIQQAASNVSSAVGKMKGDFADLSNTTKLSFGEMVGAFGLGSTGVAVFQQALGAARQAVDDSIQAYGDFNRTLKETGQAYDPIIDRQEALHKKMEEGQRVVGAYASRWGELATNVAAAGNQFGIIGAVSNFFGGAALGRSIGAATQTDAFGERPPSAAELSNSAARNWQKAAMADFKAMTDAYKAGEEYYNRQLAGTKKLSDAQERAQAAEARRLEAQVKAENRGFVRALNGRIRGFGKGDFSEDQIDPTDPYGTNKSAFQAPSDGSRDSEFGAYSPLPNGYMKALQDGQDKALAKARQWGSLFNNVIGGTLDAALNDTRNFGKNFVAILKNAFAQALTKKLVGLALNFVAPGSGTALSLASDGLSTTSLTIPRLKREMARGRF